MFSNFKILQSSNSLKLSNSPNLERSEFPQYNKRNVCKCSSLIKSSFIIFGVISLYPIHFIGPKTFGLSAISMWFIKHTDAPILVSSGFKFLSCHIALIWNWNAVYSGTSLGIGSPAFIRAEPDSVYCPLLTEYTVSALSPFARTYSCGPLQVRFVTTTLKRDSCLSFVTCCHAVIFPTSNGLLKR